MSPTSGRPKIDNPKSLQYRLRMTKEDLEKLEYCCEVTGKSKAEVLREGLELVYQSVKK